MAPPQLTLGPFEILEPIGSGGMGQVYRGRHTAEDYPVALKVVTPKTARNKSYARYFANEVRSVAGLTHPKIIEVYDYGQVSKAVSEASQGQLHAGAPWLAMELADKGSLLDWRGRLRWTHLQSIVLSLLDALAHAHARGVIHRDLKAANVLVSGNDQQIRLADFGLADPLFHSTSASEVVRAVGTPWYMAPEQFVGVRRDQGPWTDLYALGCLTWALATGRPPFPSKSWDEARAAHLLNPPPAFTPRCDVPPDFDRWLRTLIEKSPYDRFSSAADAAWSLMSLGEPIPGHKPFPHSDTPLPPVDTESNSGMSALTFSGIARGAGKVPSSRRKGRNRERVWPTPPFPPEWHQPDLGSTTAAPLGVGLGLFGLRSIPLVGRERERTELWRALSEVRIARRPRSMALVGSAGCGKSRLARWLVERAAEVGAATALRAVHSPGGGPQDGLAGMISRHFRLGSRSRAEMSSLIEAELRSQGVEDPDLWLGLSRIVAPPSKSDVEGFESSAARFVALRRLLQHLSRDRPVILWLDDAHREVETLAFVQHLLEQPAGRRLPVLVVLTVRQEDLSEYAIGEATLNSVLGLSRSTRVDVLPLGRTQRSELVRRLLGLDAELSRRVEERSDGNPLFAVQLVGNLVQQGALEPGERGFVLRAGTEITLPNDLQQVWVDRMERLLGSRPQDDRTALELAAILGQEVDPIEWHAVCGCADVYPSDNLVDELVQQRLGRAEEGGPDAGWQFVHGMLRESLEQRLRERDPEAWRRHHSICAEVLHYQNDARTLARLGRHLLAAGDVDGALDVMLEAARSRDLDPRTAEALLLDREAALQTEDVSHKDRRWAQGWQLHADVLERQGRHVDAARYATLARDAAQEPGWDDILAGAYDSLAELARVQQRFGQSLQLRRKAVRHAMLAEDTDQQAGSMARIGRLYLDVGNWRQADTAYRAALEVAQEHGRHGIAAECLTSLGYIAVKTGRDADGERYFADASEALDRGGSRLQRGNLLNALADLARKRGDFATAEQHCSESLRLYGATGTRAARVLMLNLSLFQVLQNRFDEARATIERAAQEEVGDEEGDAFLSACSAALLPCLAAAADWRDWDHHLSVVGRALTSDMFVDDDSMQMLHLAAKMAAQANEKEHARSALSLAWRVWRAMGRDDEADRTRTLIVEL